MLNSISIVKIKSLIESEILKLQFMQNINFIKMKSFIESEILKLKISTLFEFSLIS